MDINLLLILIRQMAALTRRALTEVYTVPVLLVIILTRPIPAPIPVEGAYRSARSGQRSHSAG